jgi:hypothetical protein
MRLKKEKEKTREEMGLQLKRKWEITYKGSKFIPCFK